MMTNWKVKKLNEVLKYEQPTKYIVETTDYDESFEIPVLTAGKSFLLGYTNEKKGIFKHVPAIIFDDFTTAFHYVEFPFKVKSSAMKILKCDEEENDLRFLYYQMKIMKIDTQLHKRYWISKFSQLEFNQPPLKTQKHIAQILDDAAELRDKTKQLLTEYDLLAQSIFLDMFGDPVNNPKEWSKKPLKKLGKTITGNTPPRAIPQYYGDFIEWIKTDNINTPYMYLTSATEYLSQIGMEKGRVVNEGAILVTCIAGSRKVIGNVSITDRTVSFNQQINAFVPFNDCSLFWYYHFIMGKSYVQDNATNGMKGIITKGKFEKMLFIDPPLELQNQFAEKIALIEQQKELAKQELKESEDLFNCLLQKAFKGELV